MTVKINKVSMDFFYKIPLDNAQELIKKLRLFSKFDIYDEKNVVLHTESEYYNGEIWIEPDPNNENVVFIEGNGGPFEIVNGMRKRWVVFEEIYKHMKRLEVTGELDRFKEKYHEDFGGKINILDENNGEMKEKVVNIGSYTIETPKNPLKDIKIPEERKIKKLTVDDENLFFNNGSYPLIGVMDDDTREKVGVLKHEHLKDGFGNGHYILKLHINDNIDYNTDHISQFSKTSFDFIRNNNLNIEGILPDNKIRYDKNGMRKIVLIENHKKFICVDSKKLSMNDTKKYQEITDINIVPFSLEYEEGGIIDLSDIQANNILIKSNNDGDFSVASINMGGLKNRKIIIDSNKKTEKAVLRVFNTSPFECDLPDVESFFKDKKETYVEFNTTFDKISLDSLKKNNINKATVWVLNFPVDTKKRKKDLFNSFINIKDKGIEFPEKIIFNQGFLLNEKILKGGVNKEKIDMIINEIKNEVENKIDKMTEFPEL